MFLSSLATLNFSLALMVGLFTSPISFIRPAGPALRVTFTLLLNLIAPTAVLLAGALIWGLDLGFVLQQAAFAWDVSGMYSPVVVWCVWWPAWLAASVTALGRPGEGAQKAKVA